MEQELSTLISQELQNITQEQSNYLQRVNRNLPLSQDNQIIRLKYASKRFGKMSADEIEMSAYDLLLKIHVIAGWTIPVSDLMNILADQFAKKLMESYSELNSAEVEYAFRNRGFDVKDWGKALNLSLIDEILYPYLVIRFDLSRAEESFAYKDNLLQDDFPKELTDQEWQEWIKTMKTYDINLLPCIAYEYLIKKELLVLTKEQKHEYLTKAKSVFTASLEPLSKDMSDFLTMKKHDFYSAQIKSTLITISKRLAIADYLTCIQP